MKKISGIALLILVGGCVTNQLTMDSFIKLQNIGGPFVTQIFAERLARLVIEEKYPENIFSVQGLGNVVDKGDTWWVTFDNAIKGSMTTMIPKRLIVHIRKTNGEIVTIT